MNNIEQLDLLIKQLKEDDSFRKQEIKRFALLEGNFNNQNVQSTFYEYFGFVLLKSRLEKLIKSKENMSDVKSIFKSQYEFSIRNIKTNSTNWSDTVSGSNSYHNKGIKKNQSPEYNQLQNDFYMEIAS
ncbi:hypothetical protein [Streptococcus mutans]|uniref:hypothetical protein n=1 Tax=Streptococcus mutans TaxID=1309 RepID=UPI0002B4E218|nr:hypothetical protein [Streptococcus mutans]EMC08218.1 hypothetical protein SMU70_00020 [Streptococcus mutans NLML5]EMC11770.1 hypothetical protein SMU74_05238 [Streptococcus mutans M2A]EMC50264.1 hypothetical protein SMU102_04919 [Streptococcus mutans S1B]EMC50584.1 hypothetical protein SMU104_06002 [Streptococcus mutans SA41]EMC54120.1 hypothetical protein SMU105_03792 [Streptococcus mutans SF12]